jgi:hypothetical protein
MESEEIAAFGLVELNSLKKGNYAECKDCISSITIHETGSEIGYTEAYQYYQDYLQSLKPLKSEGTINDTVPEGSKHVARNYSAFLQANEGIGYVEWKSNPRRIFIQLKNSEKEIYNLENKEEVALAEKKYGELPKEPPPASVHGQISITYGDELPVTEPSEVIEISAGTVSFIKSKSLHLKGTVQFSTKEGKIYADDVELKFDMDPLIIIDGKEVVSNNMNISTKTTLRLSFLDSGAGTKKYGDKGKNGAIEVNLVDIDL